MVYFLSEFAHNHQHPELTSPLLPASASQVLGPCSHSDQFGTGLLPIRLQLVSEIQVPDLICSCLNMSIKFQSVQNEPVSSDYCDLTLVP